MGAKDLMRTVHTHGKPVQTKSAPVIEEVKQEEVKEKAVQEEVVEVIEEKEVERPKQEVVSSDKKRKGVNKTSTPIKQIRRPDVPLEVYGLKPDITNFQIYNYELSEFLTTFSKKNKKNGGNAITKSQLMETILDVIYYDAKLEPEGFESVQELREHLQSLLK